VSSSFDETACSSYIRPGCTPFFYSIFMGIDNPVKYGFLVESNKTHRRNGGN